MKYKILFDYGLEGFRFHKDEFDTVNGAVKVAIGYYTKFFIITIIDWEATTENKGS